MTSHLVVAVDALHVAHDDEVCFLVVAEQVERSGWPLLEAFGAEFTEKYMAVRFRPICAATNHKPKVLARFGPPRSLP